MPTSSPRRARSAQPGPQPTGDLPAAAPAPSVQPTPRPPRARKTAAEAAAPATPTPAPTPARKAARKSAAGTSTATIEPTPAPRRAAKPTPPTDAPPVVKTTAAGKVTRKAASKTTAAAKAAPVKPPAEPRTAASPVATQAVKTAAKKAAAKNAAPQAAATPARKVAKTAVKTAVKKAVRTAAPEEVAAAEPVAETASPTVAPKATRKVAGKVAKPSAKRAAAAAPTSDAAAASTPAEKAARPAPKVAKKVAQKAAKKAAVKAAPKARKRAGPVPAAADLSATPVPAAEPAVELVPQPTPEPVAATAAASATPAARRRRKSAAAAPVAQELPAQAPAPATTANLVTVATAATPATAPAEAPLPTADTPPKPPRQRGMGRGQGAKAAAASGSEALAAQPAAAAAAAAEVEAAAEPEVALPAAVEPSPAPTVAPDNAEEPAAKRSSRNRRRNRKKGSAAAHDVVVGTAGPSEADAEADAPEAAPPAAFNLDGDFEQDVEAEDAWEPIDTAEQAEAFEPQEEPPAPDPTPLHSHLALRSEGQARHLAWLPGRRCPAALRQRAEAALDAAGHWPLGDAAGLQALLTAAAEAGHRIDVDAQAWEVLAEVHDAQRRVLVLEAALPDGPESAALRQPAPLGLLAQPLNRHQAEAALLAACAGRCALADDAGLGKAAQALGALVLQVRYFGVERVLIAAPADRRRRWQRLLQQLLGLTLDSSGSAVLQLDGGTGAGACVAQLRLVALEDLVADPGIAPWQAWAPQLLLVDEGSLDTPPWSGPIASALQALEVPALLVLLRSPLAQHAPESIVQLMELLDPLRLGPTERLLRQHTRLADASEGVEGVERGKAAEGRPAGQGAALAWQDLEHIGDTLLPLLLRRRPAPGSALPVCAGDDIHGLPMLPAQRQRHEAARGRLEALRSRWTRLGDLSSREQAGLRDALREMHAACLGESVEKGPKFDTLLGLLREVHQHAPDTRLVVCSHRPEVITALTTRLDAEGIPALAFARVIDPEALRLVAARFREHPSCRIALVADAVLPVLQLDDAAAGVIHLDRIGPADTLARRLRSVRPAVGEGSADAQVPVPPYGPVLQLVAEGGIEEAWLDLDGAVAEPAAERCSDGQPARRSLAAALAQDSAAAEPADRLFLDRPTLAAWMHLIGRLLAACG